MIHIIASFASLLIALGATAIILRTLSDGAEKIRLALGMTVAAPPKIEARPVRVRPAVRPSPAMPVPRLCVA